MNIYYFKIKDLSEIVNCFNFTAKERSPRQAVGPEVASVSLTVENPTVRAIQVRLRPLIYAQVRAETGKAVLGPAEERLARQIERQLAAAIQRQLSQQQQLTPDQLQQVLVTQAAGIQQQVLTCFF